MKYSVVTMTIEKIFNEELANIGIVKIIKNWSDLSVL